MHSIMLALSPYGVVFRVNVGSIKTPDGRLFKTGLPKGFSDLFFVKDGRISFIEVKVKPNKPSKEQISFLKRMGQLGCGTGVAYSIEDALMICGLRGCRDERI